MTYRIGVDVGGTFTDVQLLNEETGALNEAKVPTTTADPSKGFMEAIARVMASTGVDPVDVTDIVHGTTVVTNSLLQETFSPAGLVLSKGYRGLLEYARCNVPGPFGTWLIYEPQARPVPLENVAEAPERVDARGEVLIPLGEEAVRAIARDFRAAGTTSVGVSLLWSFMNPAHERRIRELFAEEHPECDVILSSDVFAEIQEYERAVTVALSAALKPQVADYLGSIETQLERSGHGARLYCMKSSGGAIGSRWARQHPIELAVSGPAGGVLGMRNLCESLGFDRAITFDMGGTSTDISFIENMEPALATDGHVNHYPIRVPMIDIHTIGAGGGSIAWISAGGRPRVGPRSAGAVPGPAAYGRGGTDATVTDANLILGRFPTGLLGGTMQLDIEKAEEAVGAWGARLGLSPVSAAVTIVELAVNEMETAIQEVSTRRGRDPRQCVLVAFGGAGPAHAARLAQLLQIPTVLCPHSPGVASTVGLLAAEVRSDLGRSVVSGFEAEADVQALNNALTDLRAQAWEALEREDVPVDRRYYLLTADIRYVGQQYTVNVPLRARGDDWEQPLSSEDLALAVAAFHETHNRLCGFDYRERGLAGVQLVNLRITAIGAASRVGSATAVEAEPTAEAVPAARRQVLFSEEDDFVDTPVYDRRLLAPATAILGPAVIEEFDATTLVWPGQSARVDAAANILIETKE
jgi:N-methylhydantoinase A